jgi:HK97 family phage major capsid protein
MANEIEQQLATLATDLKVHLGKFEAEQKAANVAAQAELVTKIHNIQTQLDALDKKAMERMQEQENSEPSLEQYIVEHEGLKRLIYDRRGSCSIELNGKQALQLMNRGRNMELKTVIATTASGGSSSVDLSYATSGVLGIDRLAGVTAEARPVLRVRDQFTAIPTELPTIDFLKTSVPMSQASPAQEGTTKAENAYNLTTVSERVKTIATWVPATKQAINDLPELMSIINTDLPYYVRLAEEKGQLFGDGTGENLHGITPQAAAFNTGLLPTHYNYIDVIAYAKQQIEASNEIEPTFVVLNSNDWWAIRLTKDSYGRYILGDPGIKVPMMLWDLNVVISNNMQTGKFVVGSGLPVAGVIRDRMGMTVDISFEHSDYFVKNLMAIRAEIRTALVIRRPNSYVYGSLATN